MSEILSPALYLRCSENSTEKPWNGLAWRPAMKPSTMNLARRSSRATWRITSGFRYFSAVLAKGSPHAKGAVPPCYATRREPVCFGSARFAAIRGRFSTPLRCGLPAAAAVVLGHLGLADLGD